MKLIKLTDHNNKTRGGTQWGENVTHKRTPCDDPQLCSSDVLHAYRDINLALLMNPVHANYNTPHIWECEGDIVVEDCVKAGCFTLKSTKQLPIPD